MNETTTSADAAVGKQLHWAVIESIGVELRSPVVATSHDVIGKKLPYVLYEVQRTLSGSTVVKAAVHPITVTAHHMSSDVERTVSSISFLDSNDDEGRGLLKYFYFSRAEAELEVRQLLNPAAEVPALLM